MKVNNVKDFTLLKLTLIEGYDMCSEHGHIKIAPRGLINSVSNLSNAEISCVGKDDGPHGLRICLWQILNKHDFALVVEHSGLSAGCVKHQESVVAETDKQIAFDGVDVGDVAVDG